VTFSLLITLTLTPQSCKNEGGSGWTVDPKFQIEGVDPHQPFFFSET